MSTILLVGTMYFCQLLSAKQENSDYDKVLVWDSTSSQTFCPNNKVAQPQSFESKNDVIEWYSEFVMCLMCWSNNAMDESISFNDLLIDITDDETQICCHDKKDVDCYSSSLPIYSTMLELLRHTADYDKYSFSVTEFDNCSFSISGEISAYLEIGIVGIGRGSIKTNNFRDKVSFKFDENGYGVRTIHDKFDDSGIYKKLFKWSNSKVASILKTSFSSMSGNIDYLNQNNHYFQINKTITFSVIVFSILLLILCGICGMVRCIFCGKQNEKRILIEQSSDESDLNQDEDEEIRKLKD